MNIDEAIKVLKNLQAHDRRSIIEIDRKAIDTAVAELEKPTYTADEMYLNMQYYMEYVEMKGYVTPMEWLEKHKHFGKEASTRDKASQDKVDFLKSAKQPSEITHPYDLSKK